MDIKPQSFLAFEAQLALLEPKTLAALLDGRANALAEAGRFMLYRWEDLAAALVYLQGAHAKGAFEVSLDLAVAALFCQRVAD